MRDKEKETTKIAENTSSTSCLASLSAALFPGRNECLETHCSLIEQEREDSSCQFCQRDGGKRKDKGENRVARTEQESDRRKREVVDLLVLPRAAKKLVKWCRLQQKNLSILGRLKKRVASVP